MSNIYLNVKNEGDNMKKIRRKVLSVLFLLVMASSILIWDLYVTPNLITNKVISIQNDFLTKNTILDESNLKIVEVDKSVVPSQAIAPEQIDNIIGKKLNVDVTANQILTTPMVDIDQFVPNVNEAIFAINKDDVYAINGSLRAKDKVDIYLVDSKKKESLNLLNDQMVDEERERKVDEPIIQNALVVHVRADDNNDVYDSEKGNVTNRTTSTSRVSYPELKLEKQEGQNLMKYIEEGYKLWIVRVQ